MELLVAALAWRLKARRRCWWGVELSEVRCAWVVGWDLPLVHYRKTRCLDAFGLDGLGLEEIAAECVLNSSKVTKVRSSLVWALGAFVDSLGG